MESMALHFPSTRLILK